MVKLFLSFFLSLFLSFSLTFFLYYIFLLQPYIDCTHYHNNINKRPLKQTPCLLITLTTFSIIPCLTKEPKPFKCFIKTKTVIKFKKNAFLDLSTRWHLFKNDFLSFLTLSDNYCLLMLMLFLDLCLTLIREEAVALQASG